MCGWRRKALAILPDVPQLAKYLDYAQVLSQKLVPKIDRRLLYPALFGKSAALESEDKAIVAVNAKNVAVAGQTTAFFSGVPPRQAGNVRSDTECGRNSEIRLLR